MQENSIKPCFHGLGHQYYRIIGTAPIDVLSIPFPSTDVCDCTTSVYHKVSGTTEVGINTTYNLQTSNVGLGMVGKYTLDDGALLKVGMGVLGRGERVLDQGV